MKRTTWMLMIAATLIVGEAPAADLLTTKTGTEAPIRRKRNGTHKRKGFLWGLFRKNDCGCPNH
jgi:hypothetical protein